MILKGKCLSSMLIYLLKSSGKFDTSSSSSPRSVFYFVFNFFFTLVIFYSFHSPHFSRY